MASAKGSKITSFKSNKRMKLLVGGGAVVCLLVIGFASKPAFAAYNTRQLNNTCHSYIKLVVGGDLDKAYDQSSPEIQSAQTRDSYKQILSNLATKKPEYNKKLVDVKVIDKKTGSCVINVDGLPAVEGQRTDGIFNMGAVKDGRKWKVNSVSVE